VVKKSQTTKAKRYKKIFIKRKNMKAYNLLERNLAQFLDNFPQLKKIAKTTYQNVNYWYCGDRNFKLSLHPQVQLLTPSQWAKTPTESGELFFGYYDKSPWSQDMFRTVFHRLKNKFQVEIIVYDKQKQNSQIVGISSTWNLQQGSMTQWLPNSKDRKVIFNDSVEGKLVARIVSLDGEEERIIPLPIQTIHPNGKEAVTLNYKRLDRLRSEYGYSVVASNFSSDCPLSEDGIWLINLVSGQSKLIIDLDTLIAYQPRAEMSNSEHKVNHILYSPRGMRFVFMHRWIGTQGKFSRIYVANSDGSNLKLLFDERMVSHYSWHDEENLLVWARTKQAGDRYYLINAVTGQWQIIGKGRLDLYGDGHPSFSPDRRWIVTDTYPNRARQQHLLLYEVETEKLIEIGRFLEPLQFNGARRCDLHPRWSPDGQAISIDSTHEGKRMTYILDISSIVG